MTAEEVFKIWESNPDAQMYVALKYQYEQLSQEILSADITIMDDKKGGAFERFTVWIQKANEISASLKKLRATITEEDLKKANEGFKIEELSSLAKSGELRNRINGKKTTQPTDRNE